MTAQPDPAAVHDPRLPWWSRPDSRVTALTLLVGAIVVAIQLVLYVRHVPVPGRTVVPVWVLALMFAATEGFVIHVRVRRGGLAVGLSEVPMVLGLLGTPPHLLLLARVIGGGVGLAGLRRQRGMKLGYNLALLGAQATVGSVIFGVIAKSSTVLGPREWVAAYVAMLATDMLAVALVTVAISLHSDPREWRRLPTAMRGVPLVTITTSLALVSALAIQHDGRAVALLGVVTVVAYLGYRAYIRQSQGHAQVEGLYAFTRALDGSEETGDVARIVLDQARDQLRAEVAELVVPGMTGEPGTRMRMTGQGVVETTRLDAVTAGTWWVPATAGQSVLLAAGRKDSGSGTGGPVDGIAVPVPVGDNMTGVLLVTDSLPDLPTFGEDQVRLFQALANHASVSLAKTRLVNMLRREVSEKEHQALHDPLTGLANRRQFNLLLEKELDREIGTSNPVVVMLMDLDRFKEVNDALGHDTGDALLQEVGIRLERRVGTRGVVARLGGDEFAVLLPRIGGAEEAVAMGDDILRELEYPISVGHFTLNTRASLGVALAPEHGHDAKTLLQRADVAMYAAKDSRAGARVYLPDDDRNTPTRLALIADLRLAIQRRDLLVVFQPKLDPHTGKTVGAEALARWHHPERGFIAPDEFIPLAEHSGLIRPLTLHVLEVALRRCAAWRRSGHDLHVAVNLSPNSLLDSTLPDLVTRLLAQIGVPAAALTLEITESTIMSDPAGSLATLDRLHALGVKLAIDDFGTGYSSLGRLRELPIHEVKIDKSFVQRIAVDHRDRAVVRSAVQLGHALDLVVVAEGVEDQATYAHLTREGCNVVQGYFVSRPLPADEFANWLDRPAPVVDNVRRARFGA